MRRKFLLPLVFIVVAAIGGLAATLISGSSPELGLDLQGGVSVVLEPTSQTSGDALGQSVEIIRDRVDALGVAEPEITRQGDAIVVQLPGVKNRDRALELVGQTAELRFRPVLQDLSGSEVIQPDESATTTTTTAGGAGTTTTTAATAPNGNAAGLPLGESAGAAQEPTTTTTAPPTTTTTAPGEQAPSEPVPLTSRQDDKADPTVTRESKDGEGGLHGGPTVRTGQIVSSARAEIPQGQWLVALSMKGGANGIDKFNEIAGQCNPPSATCPTGRLAIVLDSVVQSAPTINEPSYSKDDITISGSFTEGEAKDLALVR